MVVVRPIGPDQWALWRSLRLTARLVAIVGVANEHAVALYERHGFRCAGWATEPTAPISERRMVLSLR